MWRISRTLAAYTVPEEISSLPLPFRPDFARLAQVKDGPKQRTATSSPTRLRSTCPIHRSHTWPASELPCPTLIQ